MMCLCFFFPVFNELILLVISAIHPQSTRYIQYASMLALFSYIVSISDFLSIFTIVLIVAYVNLILKKMMMMMMMKIVNSFAVHLSDSYCMFIRVGYVL